MANSRFLFQGARRGQLPDIYSLAALPQVEFFELQETSASHLYSEHLNTLPGG